MPRPFQLGLIFTLLTPAAVFGQLQSPDAFLGYELGTRFTPHHQVVAYFEHVAESSPLVSLEYYGETHESRPLLAAFVASAENAVRIDDIRVGNLALARSGSAAPLDDPPAIVWLSYNVHGNESVSTEASLQTLFDLADRSNERTQSWLQNTVVVIDPCINPDGRDRYVNWYNQTVGSKPNANPDAREHVEPWPGGRTNHYYFDLNRDWSWQSQRESRQRVALYNTWMPHVHVDFHEQGINAPYYFAPAAEPYHEDITEWQRALQVLIAENHVRYFDENNWLYFTREVFDLFYPGYGDTWPTYNGAVGMTYEQGGGGRAGLGVTTAEGDTLTLRDRIEHHHSTGLSTVEATSNNADRVVSEFRTYFDNAVTNPPGRYRSYVVKTAANSDDTAAMVEVLRRQGIRTGHASSNSTIEGYRYPTGREETVQVERGDVVITAYQPKSTLLKVLMEPESTLPDSLTYDITAWSLPYVFGLDVIATTQRVESADISLPTATWTGVPRPYAYVLEWKSFDDARLLAACLKKGIRVRIAAKPFEVGGRRFDRGTIVATRAGNEGLGDDFDDVIRRESQKLNQEVVAIATGYVSTGADFGSRYFVFAEAPTVAVVAGRNVSSYGLGEVWHYFEEQLEYPITLVNAEDVGRADLDRFDVLILPAGSYERVLGEELERLKSWVRDGGKLIAIESAVSFLSGKDGFKIKRKVAAAEDSVAGTNGVVARFADRSRERLSTQVSGSIYRVSIDATHPLGYGLPEPFYTLKRRSVAYERLPARDGWNVGVLPEGYPISGFSGYKTVALLENTQTMAVQPMGRGSVVYLADNPLFRGFWHLGKRVMANAVFVVGN